MMQRFNSAAAGVALLASLGGCSLATDKAATPPASPAEARRGGVLRVGITPPGGIDPLDAYEPAGKLLSSTMCDTLVALDPVTGQLREGLARGWVVSPDGGITLKLRHGVRFNDGTLLRSTDVSFSLKQLAAPANGAYAAGLARQFVGRAAAAAHADVLTDGNSSAEVATTVNSYDLQVAPNTKDGGAVRAFAEPAMAPFSRAAYDKDPAGLQSDPTCVGPYKLSKPYVSGDRRIRLVRTTSYYGENSSYTGGGHGYADVIDFTVYPSAAAAVAGYAKGQVDVVQVPTASYPQVADRSSFVLGPATAVEFLGLPAGGEGLLTDPDLHLALSQALDRRQLVISVFGGTSEVANGFEPPALNMTDGVSLGGRTEKGAPLGSCGILTPPTPDLASARRHLVAALARFPGNTLGSDGLTLEVNRDAPYPQLAGELARQLHAGLGIKVTIVTSLWGDYATRATTGGGLQSAFRIRWSTDAMTPVASVNDQQSFLAPLLSASSTTESNWAHWNNRFFNFGMSEDAGPVTDVQQRGIAFARLTREVCSQMPLVPLVFESPAFLVRKGAVGSARKTPVGRNGVLMLRELYVR